MAFLDPHERYSAARYARDAVRAIEAIHARGHRAIVAGGTGFYLRALAGDVALAPRRRALARPAGARGPRTSAGLLSAWLAARAPVRAARSRRTTVPCAPRARNCAGRASHGADVAAATLRSAGIPFVKLVLDVPLHRHARIERRVDAMSAGGLLEEAERIGRGRSPPMRSAIRKRSPTWAAGARSPSCVPRSYARRAVTRGASDMVALRPGISGSRGIAEAAARESSAGHKQPETMPGLKTATSPNVDALYRSYGLSRQRLSVARHRQGFDPFTVLLEYEHKTHLIYKHAVSTISPRAAVALSENGQ